MNVAIILAAGESRRMGRPKQLLPFGDKTMLECVINAFSSPKVDQIVVVLGHKAKEIAATISTQPTIVTNPDYKRGMFTSVQSGLRAASKQATLVMIALCDQPGLSRLTVEKLIDEFGAKHHKIFIPIYEGRQGHPLLIRADYIKEILGMDQSLTLKHFLAAHAQEVCRLPVSDKGVLVDIDDEADYKQALRNR